MRRWLVLATTHLAVLALGFAAGIYALPILTAPAAPDADVLDRVAAETLNAGRFVRDLRGSNRLHWGEGEVRVSRKHIAHFGHLAPGPDYKLYLAPRFVDTEAAFLLVKDASRRVGDVRTFNGFLVDVPAGIDVRDYNTVVIWCESFNQFISASEYQASRHDQD